MSKSKSSKAWLREHVTDTYVKQAKADGWRSRAVFKLEEIDQRDQLFRPGSSVVDLGAAPGGWSQYAARRLQGKGRIVALDLLPMAPIAGVDFIQGDFSTDDTLQQLTASLAGARLDLVISDMAPNLSGIAITDQARMMHLAELALQFAADWLQPDGAFLVKLFQGHGESAFSAQMRATFQQVSVRKPDASRDRSAEFYLLGRRLKGR